ncbi:MAG: hypothetical protein OHK0032_18870 [Thermodesulfovibrionales bacterium]
MKVLIVYQAWTMHVSDDDRGVDKMSEHKAKICRFGKKLAEED